MSYILINAPPSPFGRKVAVALLEKGIPYSIRYDMPWAEGTCTPEYSPLEQLPILVTEEGEHVYDSRYILDWLELKHPEPPLVPGTVEGTLRQKLVQTLSERLMEIAQAVVFELQRPAPSQAWLDRQSRKIHGGLAELDKLTRKPAQRSGDAIYVGDIAAGTTLLCFEFMVEAGFCPDLECLRWREPYPVLAEFIGDLEQCPSFAATPYGTMQVDLGRTIG